jgi:hypothetical protein
MDASGRKAEYRLPGHRPAYQHSGLPLPSGVSTMLTYGAKTPAHARFVSRGIPPAVRYRASRHGFAGPPSMVALIIAAFPAAKFWPNSCSRQRPAGNVYISPLPIGRPGDCPRPAAGLPRPLFDNSKSTPSKCAHAALRRNRQTTRQARVLHSPTTTVWYGLGSM